MVKIFLAQSENLVDPVICEACLTKEQDAQQAQFIQTDQDQCRRIQEDPEQFMADIALKIGVPRKFNRKTLATWEGTQPAEKCPGILIGPTGTGKTHLAVGYLKRRIRDTLPAEFYQAQNAMLALAIMAGTAERARFISALDFVWMMRSTANPRETRELMNEYCSYDFLVLDDFGAERQTEWAIECLCKIIYTRHAEQKKTLITTNCTLAEIAAVFGERTADRMREFKPIIEIPKDTPSWRRKE